LAIDSRAKNREVILVARVCAIHDKSELPAIPYCYESRRADRVTRQVRCEQALVLVFGDVEEMHTVALTFDGRVAFASLGENCRTSRVRGAWQDWCAVAHRTHPQAGESARIRSACSQKVVSLATLGGRILVRIDHRCASDVVPQAGTHASSPTEKRVRCRSRRQKLDLAVRAGIVVVAIIAMLYDTAHEKSLRSAPDRPDASDSRSP
jgi:hypothetical protein